MQQHYIAAYNKAASTIKDKNVLVNKAWEEVDKYYFYDAKIKSYLPKKIKIAFKPRYDKASDCPIDVQNLPNEMYKRIWMVQYNNYVDVSKNNYNYANTMAWQSIKRFIYYDMNTCEWKQRKKRSYINGYEEAVLKKFKMEGKSMQNVEVNCSQPFKFFIPLMKNMENSFVFEKKDNVGKINYFLKGEASNTKIDKANERVSSNFINKMIRTSLGMNSYIEHEHHTLKTIGYVYSVDGDENTFIPTIHLEPPEENEYSKAVIMKTKHGTKLGFSISGTLSKIATSYDEKSGTNITELLDGNIDEVSVTARPCGNLEPLGLVQSIQKSLDDLEKKSKEEKKDDKIDKKELDVNVFMKKLEGDIEQDSALAVFGSVLTETMYSFRKLIWNTYYDMTLNNEDKKKRMDVLKQEFVTIISGQIKRIIESISQE